MERGYEYLKIQLKKRGDSLLEDIVDSANAWRSTASVVKKAASTSTISITTEQDSDLTVEWSAIKNKPVTFSPSPHSHYWSEIIDPPTFSTAAWDDIAGKPATFPPSAHIHAISDVTGLSDALSGKEPAISSGGAGTYWRGDKTWVTLNTSVVPEGTNLYYTDARVDARITSTWRGVASGLASLGTDGKVPLSQLPATTIVEVFSAASESAMLALTAQQGDVCVRTDTSTTYILKASPASTLSNWQVILTPTDGVSSVGLSLPSIFTVSGSPVTSTGTLTATLASQTANTFLAAPSGAAGTPSFRALAVADLPASGVTAGSYGGAASVPVLTLDAKGRVTSASTAAITPAAIGGVGGAVLTNIDAPESSYANSSLSTWMSSSSGTPPAGTTTDSKWWNVVNLRHRNGTGDGASSYGGQIAWGMVGYPDVIAFRAREASTWGAWKTLWHSGNLTPSAIGALPTSVTSSLSSPRIPYWNGEKFVNSALYNNGVNYVLETDCVVTGVVTANYGFSANSDSDSDLGNITCSSLIALSSQGTGRINGAILSTTEGVIRTYPIASTSGALYGSAVATPDGGNYSLRWTKDGAYALLNGTTESVLAINGSWVVKATSTGAQINSPWFPIQGTNPTSITNSGRWHFTGVATCSLGAPTAGRMVFLTRTIGSYTVTLTTPSGVIIWSAGVGGVASAGSGASMAYGYGGVVLMADGTNWCAC